MDIAEISVSIFLGYYWTGLGMVLFHSSQNPVDQPGYVHLSFWRKVAAGAAWPFVARINQELGWFAVCFASSTATVAAAYLLLAGSLGSSLTLLAINALILIPGVNAIMVFPQALMATILWSIMAKPLGLKAPSGIERIGA